MALMAQFGSLRFELTESAALLFQNLKLSADCETEDQVEDGQKYVAVKNGGVAQVSFSVVLNRELGEDVRGRTLALLNMAQRSEESYFYAGGEKLFPFKLMMVKADTEEIQISPGGVWVYAKVNITMKQSSKEKIFEQSQEETPASGDGGGWGGGYQTSSVKFSIKNVSPTPKPSDPIQMLQNQSIVALQNAQDSVYRGKSTSSSGTVTSAERLAATKNAESTVSTAKKAVSSVTKGISSAVATFTKNFNALASKKK